MAKGDYTDSNTKARYKALIKKPASTPTKVTIASDELRTRAEILDMVEELFVSEVDVGGGLEFNPQIDNEALRAFLHMLAKNVVNTSDDGEGITTTQANAITANTAKTGISTSQASAITANTAKRDATDIYFPVVCNMLNANLVNKQYVPFSDGITESAAATSPRNVFVAPCSGQIKSIHISSPNSTLSGGKAQILTATFEKTPNSSTTLETHGTISLLTAAGNNLIEGDFALNPLNKGASLSFVKGDRLLVGLDFANNLPTGNKNYYVTVVFKLNQPNLD